MMHILAKAFWLSFPAILRWVRAHSKHNQLHGLIAELNRGLGRVLGLFSPWSLGSLKSLKSLTAACV